MATGNLISLLGTPAERGISKEVWIAAKAQTGTQTIGTGTPEDPFDGGTQAKFDAIMANSAQTPAGSRIHLCPGTFNTRGIAAWSVRTGQQFIGAGMGVTTVKVTDVIGAGTGIWEGRAFAVAYNVDGSGSSVENLTIDANGSGLVALKGTMAIAAGGIKLRGNNCAIRNVELINARADFGSAPELFALDINGWYSSSWQSITGAIIDGCLVRSSTVGYGCAICILNDGNVTNGATSSGVMKNNEVRDWKGTSVFGFIGKDILVLNNRVFNCNLFAYGDTGTCSYIRFAGNTAVISGGVSNAGHTGFIAIAYGTSFTDIIVEDNMVTHAPSALSNENDGLLWYAPSGTKKNIVIRNNRLARAVGNSNSYRGYLIGDGTNKVEIYGNSYDPIPTDSLIQSSVTNVTLNDDPNALVNIATSDLLGAARFSGTVTSSTGRFNCNISANPSSYTILSGDRLRYEVYADENSTRISPLLSLGNAGGNVGLDALRDQNGISGYGDISVYAKGRWCFRDFDLTPLVGTSVTKVNIGLIDTLPSGSPTPVGDYIFYWRNIKIVGGNGSRKQAFYTFEFHGTPSDQNAVSATSVTYTPDFGVARLLSTTTFANLPSSPLEGTQIGITNSNTNTWGATITGTGAFHVLAYYNGTNWTVAGK